MKKTLRGKRHIRARRSVRAGREKRAVRKSIRNMKALALFSRNLPIVIGKIVNAMGRIIDLMAANYFSKERS